MFGHVKKGNKAALKRGRLFEVLEDVFFFVDIRVHKIASDLRDLRDKMDNRFEGACCMHALELAVIIVVLLVMNISRPIEALYFSLPVVHFFSSSSPK